MHDMVNAALDSNEVRAREIDQRLQALHHELFVESNPIPVKWAVQEMGLIDSGIRLPLTPLASTYQARLREVLRQAGLV